MINTDDLYSKGAGKGNCIIYGLYHPETGELRYVGKTARSLRRRLYEHVWDALNDRSRSYCKNWIRSLGANPTIKPLLVCLWDNSSFYEIALIAWAKSLGLSVVNSTDGGEGSFGFRHTDDIKAVISSKMIGVGKSTETRAKMSLAARSRKPISEATRERMRASHRGYSPSAEHRGKIAEALRGRVKPLEECQRISAGKMGHAVSAETRAKISKAKSGRRLSAEHVAKIAATKLARRNLVT
jgi:hypothetical protein